MTYVTASDVKSYSKLTYEDLGYADDASFDTFLNDLIAKVEDIIHRYCDVPSGFFQAGGVTVSEELHDYDERFIMLKYRPVISVSKVELNMAGYGQTPDWTTIDSVYYIVYNESGLIKIVNKVPAIPERSVRVTYTAGYSATPEAVKYVELQLCSKILHLILQRKISPIIRVEDWVVRLVEGELFTQDLKLLLNRFRSPKATVG